MDGDGSTSREKLAVLSQQNSMKMARTAANHLGVLAAITPPDVSIS